jgi:hypothetical protein
MISARALASLSLVFFAGSAYAADTPHLTIGEAEYLGTRNMDGTVDAFLGVPFAAPPIGLTLPLWVSTKPFHLLPPVIKATISRAGIRALLQDSVAIQIQ